MNTCPFCGSDNLDEIQNPMTYCVLCLDCRAQGPLCDTSAIAEDAWEHRGGLEPEPNQARIHMLRPGIQSAAWGVTNPFVCGELNVPGGTTVGDTWVSAGWRLVTCPCCLAQEPLVFSGREVAR